ncbi:Cullin-4B [Epithele typhae]|uniref:Cullin-4B n=1 Tax=Epithele typhae TaxID=378194 RepID=UPI002007417B|nr:Cullin-4B [Epithele typhae]KAH9927422.1 Cullin-4B [Epithele typhae]
MADVFTLLSLPSTSNAFSIVSSKPQGIPSTRDELSRSESPPRKIARLDVASNARSASSLPRYATSVVFSASSAFSSEIGPPVKPVPTSFYDADYNLVRRTISIILNPSEDRPLPETYDRISRACRAAVGEAGRGEGLYDAVKMDLERCGSMLQKTLVNKEEKSVEWLVPFTEKCAWYEKQVVSLPTVAVYFSLRIMPSPVLRRPHCSPGVCRQLANTTFITSVIWNAQITNLIMDGVADWLECERNTRKQHVLRAYLPQLVRHMLAYGLYADMIQSTYLTLTHTFYTAESAKLHGDETPANKFFEHVEQRGEEEETRAREVLVESAVAPVRDTTDSALLTNRLQWLAKDALKTYMDVKQVDQLKKLYKRLAKVGGLKVLSASFKVYVQGAVKEVVTNQARDDEMVSRLLILKAFCDKLVTTVFVDETVPASSRPQASSSKAPAPAEPEAVVQTSRDFVYGLTDAFQAGFKARRLKPAEMIAKHMDKAMRRGQKAKEDSAFLSELTEALSLYRYTDDLDVFRTFYQRALAKRLLLDKSASTDIEKNVLKVLKENYDPEFGQGEQMFTDLAVSRDNMTRFKEKLRDPSSGLESLDVKVLQRSAWPFAARTKDIDLPLWMQDSLTTYADFYKDVHSGRKLDWDHSLGTATLKAVFNSDTKMLTVSLYQAVILLLFQDVDELSYTDILAQTSLEETELKRTLQSLALGKKRVLTKHPVSKDVNDKDIFTFNADFMDERKHVFINSIQVKETAEESKRTQTSIEQDRKHAIDAAIVRVMKGKKEMMFEALKTATIEAVKNHFVPDVSTIKQRIEGLTEQEYIMRDPEVKNKYIYLA